MIFNTGAAAGSSADKIKYDNTTSGLESTEVQSALDEVKSHLNIKVESYNSSTKTLSLVSVE